MRNKSFETQYTDKTSKRLMDHSRAFKRYEHLFTNNS